MIHQFNESPGRTAIINGKEYLFFSGYSYLGMQKVQAFSELIKEGLDKYGFLFASSRISNTRLKLYEEFESLLSLLTGMKDSVSVSSGFMAGQLAVSVLSPIKNAPFSHAAITQKKWEQNIFEDWQKEIIENEPPVLATDSINILTAKMNDFSFLNQIKKPVKIIIDDSHGIGLTGEDGKGITSYIPQNENIDYFISYSLSKAFGIMGGAISCSKHDADLFRSSSIYTSSTAMSPASMFAFIHGQDLYKKQRNQLNENKVFFQNQIKEILALKYDAALPIFVLPETVDENYLFEKGIIISSFAYPDPKGKKN